MNNFAYVSFLGVLMMAIFCLCTPTVDNATAYDRLNFGVYIQPVAEGIEIPTGIHRAVFKTQLPEQILLPDEPVNLMRTIRQEVPNTLLHFIETFFAIHSNLSHYLNDTLRSLDYIIPREKKSQRPPRWICAYCALGATLVGGLPAFGVLTSQHIDEIEKFMLKENELQGLANERMESQILGLSMYAEKENTRQASVANLIATNHNFTSSLASVVAKLQDSNIREVNAIMILVQRLTQFSTQLNHLQEVRSALIAQI